MALKGAGALANYHDVPREAQERFHAWHTREHMPERLRVPGFLRARRYAALKGGPQYFILYETRDFAVLSSEAYVARLNDPTPWTREMAARLDLTIRAASRVSASMGEGVGGICATLRIEPPREEKDRLRTRLLEKLLPGIVERPGVVGAHLLESDPATSGVPTAERVLRDGRDASADWILMVEGFDAVSVSAACDALDDPALRAALAMGMLTLYRLQVLLDDPARPSSA